MLINLQADILLMFTDPKEMCADFSSVGGVMLGFKT
jgi:hypothetical protein